MHRFSSARPTRPERVIIGHGFESDDPCPCCAAVGTTVLVGTEITCLCCLCTFPLFNVVRWGLR